jgi:hypothetical protein
MLHGGSIEKKNGDTSNANNSNTELDQLIRSSPPHPSQIRKNIQKLNHHTTPKHEGLDSDQLAVKNYCHFHHYHNTHRRSNITTTPETAEAKIQTPPLRTPPPNHR